MPVPETVLARKVIIETTALFEILGHLNDQFPATVGGVLVGMESDGSIQVTESFPLPVGAIDGSGPGLRSNEISNFQTAAIDKLKKVGSDMQLKGWYLSASLGTIYQSPILDHMSLCQQKDANSILIVHDAALSRATGTLSLRAFRLSKEYLATRAEGCWTTSALKRHNLSFTDILQELKVVIHNSNLVNLLLLSESAAVPESGNEHRELSIPDHTLIESGVEDILDSIDDFAYDQGNYNYYQRLLAREKARLSQWQQRRRNENQARGEHGSNPLPLEDTKQAIKLPEEPSRSDNLMLSAQLDEYCGQVEELAALTKTNLVE